MTIQRNGIKKRRGIFFTPPSVSIPLATWAIRSPLERVLEPSFGDCGFLAALQKRFSAIGSEYPWQQIYGCDIASTAFDRYLGPLVTQGADASHFVRADFLALEPSRFSVPGFKIVLGNPPYVSHHNMFKVQRAQAARIGYDDAFRVSGMSSLWAYFVFHSLRFLLPEGRMAWLLPGSVLQADYAKSLLHEMSRRFRRVAVISLRERLFLVDGTSETTEILLCDGFGTGEAGTVGVATAHDVTEFARLIQHWNDESWRAEPLNGRAMLALAPGDCLSAFKRVADASEVTRLGDLGRLAIGIVTGNNRLFVVNDETARENRIPSNALRPILAKSSIAPGLQLRTADFDAARRAGLRCLLVDAVVGRTRATVKKYFDAVPAALRLRNVTFAKRKDWRIPDDEQIPDAFFPYMHHTGPRLLLNRCKANSTNTIHRVYFKPEVTSLQAKLAAISMLSTFSQISAEIQGRSYGAGVLKHELHEAASIALLFPSHLEPDLVSSAFARIDRLLRRGCLVEATAASDAFLAEALPEVLPPFVLDELQIALQRVRSRRQQVKTTNEIVAQPTETSIAATIPS